MDPLVLILALAIYLLAGVFVLARLQGPGLDGWCWLDPTEFLVLVLVAVWPIPLLAWFLWGQSPEPTANRKPFDSREPIGLGAIGVAISDLRPWGRVEITGQSWEARAEEGFIPAGQPIIVVGQEVQGLVVRLHP